MTGPLPGNRLRELGILESKGCQMRATLYSLHSLAFVCLRALGPAASAARAGLSPQPHLLYLENCSQTHFNHNLLWEVVPELQIKEPLALQTPFSYLILF